MLECQQRQAGDPPPRPIMAMRSCPPSSSSSPSDDSSGLPPPPGAAAASSSAAAAAAEAAPALTSGRALPAFWRPGRCPPARAPSLPPAAAAARPLPSPDSFGSWARAWARLGARGAAGGPTITSREAATNSASTCAPTRRAPQHRRMPARPPPHRAFAHAGVAVHAAAAQTTNTQGTRRAPGHLAAVAGVKLVCLGLEGIVAQAQHPAREGGGSGVGVKRCLPPPLLFGTRGLCWQAPCTTGPPISCRSHRPPATGLQPQAPSHRPHTPGAQLKALVVHDQLRPHQRQTHGGGGVGQVGAGEVGRLVGVVGAAEAHVDARLLAAGAALGAPVDEPACAPRGQGG